jgi:hypothetical protein
MTLDLAFDLWRQPKWLKYNRFTNLCNLLHVRCQKRFASLFLSKHKRCQTIICYRDARSREAQIFFSIFRIYEFSNELQKKNSYHFFAAGKSSIFYTQYIYSYSFTIFRLPRRYITFYKTRKMIT